MKRTLLTLTVVALFAVGFTLLSNLPAQEVVEPPPVVSPTYVAVPPVQHEVITEAPSAAYVWVSGHWDRTPDKWSWAGGQWVQPPFSNAYWVHGYWQHHSGKYVWESSHWAAANQGVIVAKPVTVPPLYVEEKPAAPATANVAWQPGHWEWRGTWVWVPGEYITTTIAQTVWVPGAWVEGIDGSYRWSPAHWAVQ